LLPQVALLAALLLSSVARGNGLIQDSWIRWGGGEYRQFGIAIYRATLWAESAPTVPPLALRLDYHRALSGTLIARASRDEMQRFVRDPEQLERWHQAMAALFPNVQPGDHILGIYRPSGAYFYQNSKLLGAIESPEFAAAFFAIWLDERTSAPKLRQALLQRVATP